MSRLNQRVTGSVWRLAAAGIAALVLSAPRPAWPQAQTLDVHEPLPDYDGRGSISPSAAQVSIVQGMGASASWNIFGTPQSLIRYGGYLATGLAGDAVTASLGWISANQALFRLSNAGVNDLELVNDSLMSGSNGHAVTFRQRFGGLPSTHDGMITVGITGGKIAYVSSSLAGDQPAPGPPSLSVTAAWLQAAAEGGLSVGGANISNVRQENDWTLFEVSGFDYYQRARLAALPTANQGVRPVYEANVVQYNDGQLVGYTSYVDAQTGQVLLRLNRVQQLLAQIGPPQTRTSVFTGAYVPPACGPLHGPFAAVAGDKRIDVVATSAIPANDIVVNLYFDHDNNPGTPPQAVAAQDLLTSPEHLQYVPPGGVPPGNYFVEICPFVPNQDPDGHAGTITFSNATTSVFPYPPRWKAFPANPPLDLSSTDTRQRWCWELKDLDGVPISGCDPVHAQKPELFNLAARAPWDHDFRLNFPNFKTKGNAAISAEGWFAAPTPFGALGPGPTGYQPSAADRIYYEDSVSPLQPWTNVWQTEKCNPATTYLGLSRNDIDAAAVNLFAMHNRIHDWSYFLGFTERNFNLQEFNFGNTAPGPFPLGRENDPEIGTVQAGAITGAPPTFLGRDNANQLTLQDGVPGLTNMYLWQPLAAGFYAPCVDGDYDQSVIGHEYTHAISNRMVGGPDSGLSGNQAGAMGESWSDLVAVEYLNEYKFVPTATEHPFAVGPYVTGNGERGIRNYNMTRNLAPPAVLPPTSGLTKTNPLNYSNIGYDITGVQVHADGEIWSATNYDIRQALISKYNGSFPASNLARQRDCADAKLPVTQCPGNRRWAQILFDAFLLMPSSVSMLDARDAYLAADVMRFAGANQKELWRVFARRGMGTGASSSGTGDPDPKPSFESPLEGAVTFKFVVQDSVSSAPVNAQVFVGHYQARSTPVADTIGTTTLGDQAKFVPGSTFDFVVRADGYGHVRFPRFVWSGFVGQTVTLTVKMARNQASIYSGATISGDGANLTSLIDDTESTNWASLVAPAIGDKVTVDLPGGVHNVKRVNVSAMLRPADANNTGDPDAQNRFTALRQFEIWTCVEGTDPLNLTCNNAILAGFTKIYTSPAAAFPGARPRPAAPDIILREFDVPDSNASHVQLRVVHTQCTGGPDYQGEQDADPVNATDCDTVSANGGRVRAAELQVFTGPTTAPPQDPLVVFAMTAPPTVSLAAGSLDYEISYTNVGPFASTNAMVTDTLPSELDFVSADNGGTYDAPSATITWNLGTLPVGASGMLKLSTRLKPLVLPGTVIANQADFSADLTASTPAIALTVVVP